MKCYQMRLINEVYKRYFEGEKYMLNVQACPRKQLPDKIGDKGIICFGAGRGLTTFLRDNRNIYDKVICIIDNDEKKHGTVSNGFQIYSLNEFMKLGNKNIAVVITSSFYCRDIIKQLDSTRFFDGIDCYLDVWNKNKYEINPYSLLKGPEKIPKIIHYCWFGGNTIPVRLQKCIDSWKKFCPDYEIIRWDERNYDISKNKYMLQAYENRKWGFVPDYARLDIINQYGGIYLDTDVELIRSLDELLPYEFYCGFEDERYIALGLGFGAVKGHPLIKKMIDTYQDLDFVKDGVLNLTASPVYQSKVMEDQGFELNGENQEKEGVGVLPPDAFAPGGSLLLPDEITEHTFSIHHYDASWMDNNDKIRKRHEDMRRLYIERVL